MLDPSISPTLFPSSIHTIALCAPASPAANPQDLERLLESMKGTGVRLKLMPNARLGEPGDAYSAIDARLRAQDLQLAWLDPDVQLALPIRGGGGGRDLIEALDWQTLKQRPDFPVLGFSDLTLLHAAMLAHHCGRPITSPTFLDLPHVTPDSRQSLRDCLAVQAPCPYHLQVLRKGNASGLVFAAHLQRLASLANTPFQPSLAGRMLFLECPHRTEEQILTIFINLLKTHLLHQVSAVIFGQFPDCTSPLASQALQQSMADLLPCPVLADFPFGHTSRLHTLDAYATATVDTSGTLQLTPGPDFR